MNGMVLADFFVSAAIVGAAAIRMLLPVLRRRQIVDRPNERSSHVVPTPRGAGLAIVPVVAAGWIWAALSSSAPDAAILWCAIGALVLCAISWLDDVRGLSATMRLGAHVGVVAVLLAFQPPETRFAQGWLPFWADRLLAGLAWVWFINLFNFMDGIDGISGVETGAIAIGLLVLAAMVPALLPIALPAAVLAGAAAGFLVFNWHPAKIFLGDSGSVPLGLMLGWLLLELAASGFWAAAVILPLYYLADATITITRRLMRGERIWQAHRQHFYQRAVAGGASHARVSTMIALANLLLILCAAMSPGYPLTALVVAAAIVILLLSWMQQRAIHA